MIDRTPRLTTPDDEAVVFTRTSSGGYLWQRPLALKAQFREVNRKAAELFMKAMGLRSKKFYEQLNEKYKNEQY